MLRRPQQNLHKNDEFRNGDNKATSSAIKERFGKGNGNQLQYPCLENPMDGEAW